MTKSIGAYLYIIFKSRYNLLISSLFVSLLVLLATWPLLGRSPWGDEVALFTNFPLSPLRAFFSPLPYYNQAATPLYSVAWSLLGFLNPFYIRILSFLSLLFASIYLISLLLNRYSLPSAFIAAASIAIYKPAFIHLSEMKHYGLEILACLCIIVWLARKDPQEPLKQRDIFILLVSLLLGISTFLLGIIALAVYFAQRLSIDRNISMIEYLLSATFVSAAASYFFLIKRIVFFQVSNYPDTYSYVGVTVQVKRYFMALYQLIPGESPKAMIVLLVMPLSIVLYRSLADKSSQRLLAFLVITNLVYLALSALGVYPVMSVRHVIWFSAFLWAVFAVSISFIVDVTRQFTRSAVVSFIPIVAITVISFSPLVRADTSDLPVHRRAQNDDAISHLKKMPSSKIRFWIAGEPVFHYYLRHDPSLSRFSFRDFRPRLSALIKYKNPETYTRGTANLLPFARDAFRDVQSRERFLIFASHYNRSVDSNRTRGLHDALAERMCQYSVKDFAFVSIYDVVCDKSSPPASLMPVPMPLEPY